MAGKACNIIKYDGGDNRILVYKTAITDFTAESILVVDESQQALLYRDGQAEAFGCGRHTLPTNNISKFRALFSKLFGSGRENLVSCDVFFINTVNDVSVDWGTPSRILVKDPVYNELVNVGANGSLKVKITDPMRFVKCISGRMGGYSVDRIAGTVRAELMTVLKTNIAEMIVGNGVSLLEIQTKLSELSVLVERKLNERLADFGLTAVHLTVQDISVDGESQSRLLERQRKINSRSDVVLDSQAQTDADYMRTLRMADAKARERAIQGYTYQDEQYWATQRALAGNPAGAYRNDITGQSAAYQIEPDDRTMGQPEMPYGAQAVRCTRCGSPLQQNALFCGVCGCKVDLGQQPVHRYQAAANRTCPVCGYPLTPRMTVCPSCDFDLEGDGRK